jgi:hypothetical protein
LFIYWIIFVALAVGALLNSQEGFGRSRPAFLLIATIPTALMIGLRWKIGPDWPSYLDIFDYTKLFSFDQSVSHLEPGFYVLNWLLHQFDSPFWVLNLICGTVFTLGLSTFCRRQPNPWLAFIVAFPYLVIVVAMSGDRQSLALGVLFFALNAFEDGKLYRFVLLTLLASTFHGSVLLMIPICLLSYTASGAQRAFLVVAGLGLGYYFFQDAFSMYAHRYSNEKIQSTGVAYRLAMNVLSAAIFLAIGKRFDVPPHIAKLWRNISLCTLALVLVLALIPSSTAVDRFLLYFFPLQFFVLSRLPNAATEDRHAAGQVTMLVVAYAALVQFVFLTYGTFAPSYVPYKSLLSA